MEHKQKIRIHRVSCLVFFLFALSRPGWTQVKFYSLVSESHVSYNQTFQVQYIIEGAKKIQQFNMPDFPDFQLEEVFELPATPALDPKTLKLVEQHSKIAWLTPVRTGVFLIPGATAIIDGKRIRSNSVKVNVKASPLSRNMPESSGRVVDGSELKAGESVEEKVRNNFFVRAEISKPVCYAGEPIMATYKAYSRVNANSHVVRRPAFTGFSVIEMVDGYEANPAVEQYNGSWYYVHLIRKVQLFPLQPGKYELDPAEIEGTIHFIRQNNADQGPAYQPVDHNVNISTNPVPVTVLPLPDSLQPDSYTGAVGQYSMSVKVSNPESKNGELVKLQVVIAGSGNLPLVTAPEINWPAGIEANEPAVKESINKYVFPLTGSKTFTYSLVTSKTGDVMLPPVTFSFFDPAGKRYRILQRDSIMLIIQPAGITATQHGETKDLPGASSYPRERIWFGLVAAAILSWIVFQLIRSFRSKKPVPVSSLSDQPPDRFATARQLVMENKDQAFYYEVLQQLCAVAGQKCQVTPSGFNKRNIQAHLLELGVSSDTANAFNELLATCEWALYAVPATDTVDKSELLKRAEKITAAIVQEG